jgi:hypothetical protein
LSDDRFWGTVSAMAECGERAVLIVTKSTAGTATNLVRRRVDLRCQLEAPHDGAHRDLEHGEAWDQGGGRPPTLLRHEDDEV